MGKPEMCTGEYDYILICKNMKASAQNMDLRFSNHKQENNLKFRGKG